MKKKINPNSDHVRLNLRLTEQEWKEIHEYAANSNCRSVSEYARKVLTELPVNVFYRNQSFDDFEEQMATHFLPLLDHINDRLGELNFDDPVLSDIIKNLTTIFKDIRKLLAKLSNQCDPK